MSSIAQKNRRVLEWSVGEGGTLGAYDSERLNGTGARSESSGWLAVQGIESVNRAVTVRGDRLGFKPVCAAVRSLHGHGGGHARMQGAEECVLADGVEGQFV